MLHQLGRTEERGFRWRGKDVSRIENLSDAVFGFSITLLVVSLEVPATFPELMQLLRGFVPFAVCAAILGLIWHAHYQFFRRYGLHDGTVMLINAVLLFLVLFYLYPLKFLAGMLFALVLGQGHELQLSWADGGTLLWVYSGGYAAVFLALAGFYVQAWRRRADLDLSRYEELKTLQSLSLLLVHVVVALMAIGLAVVFRGGLVGMVYFLIAPLSWVVGAWFSRRLARLEPVVV